VALCVILMTYLEGLTWLRFGIWMIAGLVIYFAYGRRRIVSRPVLLAVDENQEPLRAIEAALNDRYEGGYRVSRSGQRRRPRRSGRGWPRRMRTSRSSSLRRRKARNAGWVELMREDRGRCRREGIGDRTNAA
jgi:hypothetical protein